MVKTKALISCVSLFSHVHVRFPHKVAHNYSPGEHIDYCGYGVLPMAIEQDIVVAVSLTDDNKLRLYNTDETFR